MRGHRTHLPQGHEVTIRTTAGRHRRQRQRPSVTSNNSSLSSYSPPWILTQTPQSQDMDWPNDHEYDLSAVPSVSVANTASSTWQEEAHWMSFRNAVYCLAQTLQEASPSSNLDDSQRTTLTETACILPPASEDSPPVRHILELRNSVNDNVVNPGSTGDQGPSRSNSTSEVTGTDSFGGKEVNNASDAQTKDEKDSLLKSMASDLAETKMRLALAQAERDELEFALLMGGASDSRSLSGGS